MGRPFPARERRTLHEDERGNLLLISGVLLILGFVVLGGTLTQLHSLEGTTARVQRDGVVVGVEDMMEGLGVSLYESLLTGETNVTDFEAVMRNLERGLVESAARSGLYVSLVPTTDDPAVWLREDRCLGYNPDDTKNGVVVGYTVVDLEETIAGIVYDVHATDGRQAIHFTYYVTIEQCSADEITTVYVQFAPSLGSFIDPQKLRTTAGSAFFSEERDWDQPVLVNMSPSIITPIPNGDISHWQNQGNIVTLDGDTAKVVTSVGNMAGNYLQFYLEAPPYMEPGDRLEDITISVTGRVNYLPSLQTLELLVYHPANASVPTSVNVVPLTATMDTHDLLLANGPSGPGWTTEEIEGSRWRLRATGSAQGPPLLPLQEVHVDHFSMVGSMEVAPYRMRAELEWPTIPEVFGDHRLQMKYEVQAGGTAGEAFLLQVYDPDPLVADWVDIVSMEETQGEVVLDVPVNTFAATAEAWSRPIFRVIDNEGADFYASDRDTIEIQYLRIVSELQGA